MSKKGEIISDFEELFKLQDFYKDEKREPYDCTYELISRSLKNEYAENIESKIERWVNISRVLYFKDVLPVKFYLQAKMLYRDGFYEAAITLSRSICEMICYDLLQKHAHPFGTYENIESENFRTLVKFLALPKSIEKKIFDVEIISKITTQGDRNFIKSAYHLDSTRKTYLFKIENGRVASTLNRFFKIFEETEFSRKDNFPNDSYIIINQVYDNGNTYVHARKSRNTSQEDAINNLNGIGEVLHGIYGVSKLPINQIIKSGYAEFPDICTGMNFALTAFATKEDAMRGYYNLPSTRQINKMISVQGNWIGEWYNGNQSIQKGRLIFRLEGEYLYGNLISVFEDKPDVAEPLEIKLFGEYFQLKGYYEKNMHHDKNVHNHFEMEFFNDQTLIGINLNRNGKVLFKRVE